MTILCRVCAEFRNPDGTLIHKVGTAERNVPHQAPDMIIRDPLFTLLESDGSLTAVTTKAEEKKLENTDPTAGVDASGKRLQPTSAKTESDVVFAEGSSAGDSPDPVKPETKTTGRTRKTGAE